ncbi:MAG: hypothetical protein LC637_10895, partial [Xanthomonadaceae bacterium]|nr:hypothetical protein [Xanthomonadaceae bacterium]
MKQIWIAILASTLVLAGCGQSDAPDSKTIDDQPARAAGTSPSNAFIDRIDRDTAYAYVNLERLPSHVIDKIWAVNDATSAANDSLLDALAEDDEVSTEMRALVAEITELATREGWENAGLHANPTYAIHSVSLFPFVHLELSDNDRFEALIQRVEARLDKPLPRRDVDGVSIIWFEFEPGFGIALQHSENAATLALIPDDPTMLARLAGLTGPALPMDVKTLDAFNAETGLTAYGSGFLDWRLLVAELLNPDSMLARIGGSEALEQLRATPACAVELDALTTAIPRVVFGYSRLNASNADFLTRIETSPAIGQGLMPIAQAPVSIDRPLTGLFNLGMAFDLVAAREFGRSMVDGWVENPPTCPAFEGIAENAATLQQGLNRPIPPMITNLQGVFLAADELEMADNAIPAGGGTLSFYMRNPQLLVGMAELFSPAVAELQLQPGSEPQKVPNEALPQLQA